jgi:4-diphosphocytidyl-2C-methyl-D-erythritol kinase
MKIRIQTPAFITSEKSPLKPVALYDDMEFEKLDERKIKIIKESGYKIPTNDENPAFVAAAAMQTIKPNKLGVEIRIKKNIPSFCGLSCQPGNAAGTLIALNKLWKMDLSEKELMNIAKKLSPKVADILKTYFKPCSEPEKNIVLVRPKYITIDSVWIKRQIEKSCLKTTAENVIMSYFPDIKEMIGIIKDNGYETSGITGLGPVIFGISDKPIQTDKIKKALKEKIDFFWCGKSCNKWGELLM